MLSFEKIGRMLLRSSLLWGTLAAVAFYVGLQQIQDWVPPLAMRYLTGRWEAYACVGMFFVGLAALLIKAVDLGLDTFFYQRLNLGPLAAGEPTVATVRALIKTLDGQPRLCQATVLCRRLREAFDFVVRKGGQEPVDNHLRYLADIDAARMNTSYGMPKFLCWAIPAVGSLGAVVGIALTIGMLSTPTSAETSAASAAATPTNLFAEATSGLALAFDTMALAIGLSIVLMVGKFACEQIEGQLLDAVEVRVQQEVTSRAGNLSAPRGSQTDSMRFVVDKLSELTEKLSSAPIAGAAPSAGMSNDQIESIVSRAVAKAVTGQPTVSYAGGGQLTDMSQVQDALKQIAAFFSIQQAEHQQESEIVRQLSDIIRESDQSGWKPRKEKDSVGGSLAGLWNALSD